MKFIQHYSGSKGNFYEIISQNGHRLIIDPGVKWDDVQKALGYNYKGIEACFATHQHLDHCKSLHAVQCTGIPVYASKETLKKAACDERNSVAILKNDLITNLESFQVFVFETMHDCPGSCGFVVLDNISKEYLLFVTDSKFIPQRFKMPFSIIAIEASYCGKTLKRKVDAGEINETFAKRLLDSHQEITVALDYVKKYLAYQRELRNDIKLHELHLLHMSGRNSDRAKARKLFHDRFGIDIITVGKGK